MFRKVTLGLIAAASLGIATLAPGFASANGLMFGWGWGWGWGWGYGGIRAARRSKGVNGDSVTPRGSLLTRH
jgi:hypothetical protein